MFELCLRFFLSYKLLEINYISLFLFLNLEFFFSRTRGSAGAIANPYAISYCLSTFYFSKLLKNLTNYAFSSGKTCEKYSEFPANQTFARIILLWLQKIMGLSRLVTRLVVVFVCGMRPHGIRDVESILRVMLTRDRDSAILCHPMPFLRSRTWFAPRLVSFRRGLSRAVTCSFYAVIFPRSRSCRLCWDRIWEPDSAVTRAQLNGADPLLIGLLRAQSHPPLSWFRTLQPWVPN
jgi:hypothetical protein